MKIEKIALKYVNLHGYCDECEFNIFAFVEV